MGYKELSEAFREVKGMTSLPVSEFTVTYF